MQSTILEFKSHDNKKQSNNNSCERQRLRDKKVSDVLTPDKRRLVEVPYAASLAHTMNTLVANRVVAVPVAAPPGHWIGAGGSMILESDKQTGSVRKHYIGMVTMLDVLYHIAEDDVVRGGCHLDQRMAVPVSAIIGHCLESLSLWTLNPNTSIPDCMEVFSKGIHRALVPIDSHMENIAVVELAESASSYQMLTQMDLLRFLKAHASEPELRGVMSHTVSQLGGVTDIIFGVTHRAKVIQAIKCMRAAALNAVPIVEASSGLREDHSQLINAKGRKLIGTFSSTDLRGCPISQMQSWLQESVLDFTETLSASPSHSASTQGTSLRELVACRGESNLAEVIDKAVTKQVHRVWVVDQQGLLDGLVSLTDMIRVTRASLLSESSEIPPNVHDL